MDTPILRSNYMLKPFMCLHWRHLEVENIQGSRPADVMSGHPPSNFVKPSENITPDQCKKQNREETLEEGWGPS